MLGNRNTTAKRALIEAPRLFDRSAKHSESTRFVHNQNALSVIGFEFRIVGQAQQVFHEFYKDYCKSLFKPDDYKKGAGSIRAYWSNEYGLWNLYEDYAYTWFTDGDDAGNKRTKIEAFQEGGVSLPLGVDKLLIDVSAS